MPIRAVTDRLPESVVAFLDTTISPRGVDHWRWKYRSGQHGAPAAFYWEAEGGEVVGFIGLLRTTLHTAGAVHPAAWFVDWHVRAGTSGGVGLGLLRRAEAEAGILVTLQGTADTRSILPRLGWHESRRPLTWARPLTGRFIGEVAARHVPRGLRSIIGPLASALTPLLRPSIRRAPAGCALVEVERFGPEYDPVWDARRREMAPLMARDSAYLDAFCADFPDRSCRMAIARRDGIGIGHAIWRIDIDRRGLKRGRIVDVLWPRDEGPVGAWLVSDVCSVLQQAGADYIECVASTHELTDIVHRLRFRQWKPVSLWYHRIPEGAPPDSWYITLLDCDRAYR